MTGGWNSVSEQFDFLCRFSKLYKPSIMDQSCSGLSKLIKTRPDRFPLHVPPMPICRIYLKLNPSPAHLQFAQSYTTRTRCRTSLCTFPSLRLLHVLIPRVCGMRYTKNILILNKRLNIHLKNKLNEAQLFVTGIERNICIAIIEDQNNVFNLQLTCCCKCKIWNCTRSPEILTS